ncbi:hypothetical protein [Mangrovactinospora gilvigrisea]|nr:hypothetical protein [Mangrovactinospora gilvigrisea]
MSKKSHPGDGSHGRGDKGFASVGTRVTPRELAGAVLALLGRRG